MQKAAMETSRFTETNGSEDRLEMFFWWVL